MLVTLSGIVLPLRLVQFWQSYCLTTVAFIEEGPNVEKGDGVFGFSVSPATVYKKAEAKGWEVKGMGSDSIRIDDVEIRRKKEPPPAPTKPGRKGLQHYAQRLISGSRFGRSFSSRASGSLWRRLCFRGMQFRIGVILFYRRELFLQGGGANGGG